MRISLSSCHPGAALGDSGVLEANVMVVLRSSSSSPFNARKEEGFNGVPTLGGGSEGAFTQSAPTILPKWIPLSRQ